MYSYLCFNVYLCVYQWMTCPASYPNCPYLPPNAGQLLFHILNNMYVLSPAFKLISGNLIIKNNGWQLIITRFMETWCNQMETFSMLLALCEANHGSLVVPLTRANDSELWFFLTWTWTNGWANNCNTCDLRCHWAHYDVTVMQKCSYVKSKVSRILRIPQSSKLRGRLANLGTTHGSQVTNIH